MSTAPNLTDDPVALVRAEFERLRDAFRQQGATDYRTRMDLLAKLRDAISRRKTEICEAIARDFGHRSHHETLLAEILVVQNGIDHTRAHLHKWMRPESRPVSWLFKPASAQVVRQPLGVVGIIAPWNYPFQLAMVPITQAISAGNRVLLKPSELTPATADLIASLCAEVFPADLVAVVQGGVEVGDAVARLPLDHLLFTGSTRVGRLIMKAAAENLVPVTLELGGKSPFLIHPDFPLDKAADRLVAGKMLNAGQTCIAPDYVLVHEDKLEALVQQIRERFSKAYPTIDSNPDYTSIVNEGHHRRLKGLLEEAERHGARVVEINPAGEPMTGRKIPLTLVLDATDEMAIMQEEIFGPLLPIRTYRILDEALDYINDHERPLALYYFDYDTRRANAVLERTHAGGVCVNEVLVHCGIDDLPFGGVGASGMGRYHGFEGFQTFSHEKAVVWQARLNGLPLMSPPYGKLIDRILGVIAR